MFTHLAFPKTQWVAESDFEIGRVNVSLLIGKEIMNLKGMMLGAMTVNIMTLI
jgi:hypothetical protein